MLGKLHPSISMQFPRRDGSNERNVQAVTPIIAATGGLILYLDGYCDPVYVNWGSIQEITPRKVDRQRHKLRGNDGLSGMYYSRVDRRENIGKKSDPNKQDGCPLDTLPN